MIVYLKDCMLYFPFCITWNVYSVRYFYNYLQLQIMYIVRQIFRNTCFFNIETKRRANLSRNRTYSLKLVHYYTSISTEQISITIDMIQQKVRSIKRS